MDIEPDPRWAVNDIDSAKLISPSGKEISIGQKADENIGYILDRKVFDKDLAIQAVQEGSDIHVNAFVKSLILNDGIEGVTCSFNNERKKIKSEIIIAADRVTSKIGRLAGIDTTLGPMEIESCTQFRMAGIEIENQHTLEFYFGREIAPGGYIWVFPKSKDIANVGIGVLPDFSEKASIEYLKDFINSKAELNNGKIVEFNTGGVPVSGPLEKTITDNFMIVGDAARLVNPMTGGGINFAMKSGRIAGEVAADAITEGDTSEERLMEYENRWRKEIGIKLENYKKGKNVLIDLSDEDIDKIAETFQNLATEQVSIKNLVKMLENSNPKITWGA